ncbi:Transmembrane protein [Orchesella cincta]|uniref:Transmembrane protein n=1 Tax=Orchesella cincta TaxID=48709 RepID=A0A1D2NEE0_ORCCI|nr:Transmembrane protein [Orchesella cincta]
MRKEERQHVKIPFNINEAKALATVLNHYKENHYWIVLMGLTLLYVFLQTFMIPGAILLTLIYGFLFPAWVALPVVCLACATGASGCYMLSLLVGRRIIRANFPERIQQWTEKVEEQRDNLLNFIIFLRITPILPNWFINIASPIIGVPLSIFWLGTFIGVAPPSLLVIQAGSTLNAMTSSSASSSYTSLIILAIIALVSLIPVFYRSRH